MLFLRRSYHYEHAVYRTAVGSSLRYRVRCDCRLRDFIWLGVWIAVLTTLFLNVLMKERVIPTITSSTKSYSFVFALMIQSSIPSRRILLQQQHKQQQSQYYRESLLAVSLHGRNDHHHHRNHFLRFDGSRTTTCLFVSELHIPGYVESKKAFLMNATATDRQWNIKHYTPIQDYTSYLPFGIASNSNNQYTEQELDTNYLVHKTTVPIFSTSECQSIIDEAEYVARSIMPWTTNRHGNYPTTDLPLVELPNTLHFLKLALLERIYPMLRSQFSAILPDPYSIRVADGFVVKYDANNGQTQLKPHRDGSVLSFNIALNPSHQYNGGGTWFASDLTTKASNQHTYTIEPTTTVNNEPYGNIDNSKNNPENDPHVLRLEQGCMVSHASGLLHGGHGITSGVRYILVAFCILEGYDSYSMRLYNQVRNI